MHPKHQVTGLGPGGCECLCLPTSFPLPRGVYYITNKIKNIATAREKERERKRRGEERGDREKGREERVCVCVCWQWGGGLGKGAVLESGFMPGCCHSKLCPQYGLSEAQM